MHILFHIFETYHGRVHLSIPLFVTQAVRKIKVLKKAAHL